MDNEHHQLMRYSFLVAISFVSLQLAPPPPLDSPRLRGLQPFSALYKKADALASSVSSGVERQK